MHALMEILEGALTLDPNDRAALAEQLLASLDDVEGESYEDLWIAEAERRLADHQTGRSGVLSAAQVADEARKRFK